MPRISFMRDEGGRLSLEAENAPMRVRLLEKDAGIVDQISRREVVGTIEDNIVPGEDIEHIALIEPGLMHHHMHVRVQCFYCDPSGFDLRHADALSGVDHLSLQIRIVDDVGVDDPKRADSSGGEIECRRGPKPARPDQEDLGVEELALSLLTNLRDQQVAAIPPALIRGQGLRESPR
ncbi:MAG: hypothetical protein K0Q89_3152 [Thermomicrobiales bacterium]|nr:hypothetical protein [Thermomicrobiales bacterium]